MFPFLNPSVTLENVQRGTESGTPYIQCRCVACARQGEDNTGQHLRIYSTGAFRCAKYPNDRDHNRIIRSILRSNTDEVVDLTPEPTARVQQEVVYPESILEKLMPDYSYWIGRGVDPDIFKRLGGGVAASDEKSKLSGRFIHPIRNLRNQICGFAGRLIEENNFSVRWKILGRKSHFIFPPSKVSADMIISRGEIILCEGIGCVLKLASCNIWNTISLFGINISSQQISFLIGKSPLKIIIATNNEKSGIGNAAAQKIKEKLSRFFNEDSIIVRLPTKKDFAEMTEQEIVSWTKL